MIGLDAQLTFDATAVVEKARRAAGRVLSIASFRVRQSAVESIKQDATPSRPGHPPHTRQGRLKKSIAYDVDRKSFEAIVGPMASVVGKSAAAHERGEQYKGFDYDARPFMWPALDANADDFAKLFKDTL